MRKRRKIVHYIDIRPHRRDSLFRDHYIKSPSPYKYNTDQVDD